MAGERYKHIFLSGPTRTQGFTNPRSGGKTPSVPDRDRSRHSAYLKKRLADVWAKSEHRRAVVVTERNGAYIDFLSEPGFELPVQSLESVGSGIRLLNVRTEGEGEAERTFATVYIPNEKRGYFIKKVQEYATEIDGRSNKPKNLKLVNSISDIRLSVLESFYQKEEYPLIPGDEPEWVEVWLSSDEDETINKFKVLLQTLNAEAAEGILKFPERSVTLIRANKKQLEQLIEYSDHIAELRAAKEVATFYIEMEPSQQSGIVQALLERCRFEDETDVSICILDTGVNNGHLLIKPLLSDADLHTVREEWGTNDHDKHGTLMAGTAAYGDLLSLINGNGPVRVVHRLESAKILPPPPEINPKKLWGFVTAQGISRAEIQAPERKRVVCLAVSTTDHRDRGKPSSWSGELDVLASGYTGDKKRLIVVSAGNVDDPACWRNYPDDNLTNEVQDPGQAWNALTVGAFTEKTRITHPTLSGYTPIAPSGGLSPYSTTSLNWPSTKWPIKPEVLFEGGNIARDPQGVPFDTEDLKLFSTYYRPQEAQFAPFYATSAASAQAAWMAAQIQAQYPEAWPETIRALIVHSANWTDAMKRQFLGGVTNKGSYARLSRICGYGVPNLDKALYCLSNSLTLISQAELQPYDKKTMKTTDSSGKNRTETQYITQDMHLYNLPWPTSVLSELKETIVTMRVTLSYFIEPAPGEIGWENRYRYASHALRFDVNGPVESEYDFIKRINVKARDDEERPGTEGAGRYWKIGEARNVGSIHSDIWEGRAADLAGSNMIAVYPAVGWWRERTHLNRWDSRCRYVLVVSIYTPTQDIDIYTPVMNQIRIPVPIEIPVNRYRF